MDHIFGSSGRPAILDTVEYPNLMYYSGVLTGVAESP
jgi:hypothetical protein